MKKRVFNPYLPPTEYVADGEPYVFENRVYVFGSHDEADGKAFCVGDYVVWSAPVTDLSDWRYEGVSYQRTADPHNAHGQRCLYAPDVVRGKDGRYYLYYCLSFLDEFGVAVSDRPAGPYQFYGHVHRPDGSIVRDFFPYDPAVLVEDEAVYLYYGFDPFFSRPDFVSREMSPGCMVMKLEFDMLTVKEEPRLCLPGRKLAEGTSFPEVHAYFEAPSIRKIGAWYYLVYCSQSHNELCYAVSQLPDRNFVYQGTIISNGDLGYHGNQKPVYYTGNIHGGLVEIKKQWYIFYHRHTHAVSSSRQACAEPIAIDEEGRITQVPITSCGLNGGPLPGSSGA